MAILVFVLGLAIGSFLNVLILRLPKDKSILGFSKCPKCQKGIAWYDNIPVLSFLNLRGRCRNCQVKISFQYPLVELLSGFLFFTSYLIYPDNLTFLTYLLFLISLLIVIAFIDLRNFIILDNLILTGLIVFSSYLILHTLYFIPSDCSLISCSFKDSFFGTMFFSGIFLFLFLVSRGNWIGFGDVKLAFFLGFVFGLENSINIFYLTFLIGTIIAIILLAFKGASLKTKLPLGSIMSLAVIIFILTGFNFLDLIKQELILRIWG